MILLSVWMWERFSVGRAKVGRYKTWDDHGNPLRRPTWAYKWDTVTDFTGDPQSMYETFSNEFDSLTPEMVIVMFLSSQLGILKFLDRSTWFNVYVAGKLGAIWTWG